MGAAAYQRGSANIRRQIKDDQEANITVSRRYVSDLEGRLSNSETTISDLQAQIATLSKSLSHVEIAMELRRAERDVAVDERKQVERQRDFWKEQATGFKTKWLKCSAILNLIKLYSGREKFEDWHEEAKTDHPELWASNDAN